MGIGDWIVLVLGGEWTAESRFHFEVVNDSILGNCGFASMEWLGLV